MAELLATESKWMKAEAYELVDGYIQPAPGSPFHAYDAMADYWLSAKDRVPGDQARVPAPYQGLFESISACTWELRPDGFYRLTQASEEALLEWVNTHGLLGILPHHTVQVAAHYQREAVGDRPAGALTDLMWSRDIDDPTRSHVELPHVSYGFPRSLEALVQDPLTGEMRSIEWGEAAADFCIREVKGLTGSVRCPLPDETSFWEVYREPTQLFVQAAGILHQAFKEVAVWQEATESDPNEDEEVELHEWSGPASLNRFLSVVRPSLSPPEAGQRYRGGWRSASLLGILALQIYSDLSYGRTFRPQTCPYCGIAFGSRSYQSKYCSDRCRKNANRSRQRDRAEARAVDEKDRRDAS